MDSVFFAQWSALHNGFSALHLPSESTCIVPAKPGAPCEATQYVPGSSKVYRKLLLGTGRPLLKDLPPWITLNGAWKKVNFINLCIYILMSLCVL